MTIVEEKERLRRIAASAIAALDRSIEVHDLHGRVHASVGPSGGSDLDAMIRDEAQRAFHFVLKTLGMRLMLPAAIASAVVLEAKGDARHGEMLAASC